MKLFCGTLLACFSLFSCKQQSTNEQQAFAELDRIFSNYCFDEHSTQFTSHNLMIFTKQGRWVPSYYLVVKKVQNNIVVTYHEVDKINEVANSDMLFFRGITFSIDSNKSNTKPGVAKTSDYDEQNKKKVLPQSSIMNKIACLLFS